MIVSVAIDVLPVCLSPIINSLCPRPIGNIESIARIPVSSGTLTDLRSIIPGASCSIGRYPSEGISPFPSIGAPRASTTLPKYASPTGIPAFFPVLVTFVPSLIPVSFPSKMTPISFLLIS